MRRLDPLPRFRLVADGRGVPNVVHCGETTWPWYSNIAPISWLTQNHVVEGREHLNFSDWNQSHGGHGEDGHEAEEMGEVVLEGEMPMRSYLLTHPEARLTEAELQVLAEGLMATAGGSSQ